MNNELDPVELVSPLIPETPHQVATEIPEQSFTNLTVKQNKFVQSYVTNNQGKLSAMNAGYPEKSAGVIGCQLLKNPKILNAIDLIRTKLRANITKEQYIDKAMQRFERLDDKEPNSPRFLDIAGKALGYIGANGTPTSVINNTQVNIGEMKLIATPDKWKMLRDALEHE